MKYISTRGKAISLTSAEAILQGQAEDGGLLVPESIPTVNKEFIESLISKKYEDKTVDILKLFLTDYSEEELHECAELAYNYFDLHDRVRLAIENGVKAILELWHGPTSAFKDMALQMLPQLMSKALTKTNEKSEIMILTATSGDTGKAALAGFADVPNINITVFYPAEGVSEIQKLQMVTQVGNNVKVIGIEGNFDDCQRAVKEIFIDEEVKQKLAEKNIKLSSANSINWGRLAPQIVYYFAAYAELINNEEIKNGDEINVAVPTGNFGDILAAYYAKRMGLPINKLICASNRNNILTDFFKTGIYDKNRKFYKTISPSMDILISSNLERLLYHETDDTDYVKSMMEKLNSKGKYEIKKDLKKKLQKLFYADYATDDETKAMIKQMFENMNYLVDTHTAVALSVMEKYKKNTADTRKFIVASTASAFKFAPSVLQALDHSTENLNEFEMLKELNKITNVEIPIGLANLKSAKILHERVCSPSEIKSLILE